MTGRGARRRNRTLRKHDRERPGFEVLDHLLSLLHHHLSLLFAFLVGFFVQDEWSSVLDVELLVLGYFFCRSSWSDYDMARGRGGERNDGDEKEKKEGAEELDGLTETHESCEMELCRIGFSKGKSL